ncbi:MAG: sugar ABC transporter permease [Chloroflexi bacterium]|nr:sugar ABC transporter permease [Chloroflexota bacterium]MBK6710131.1 sugar ABC transporter permease [Chloroflexota bacterium]MBK7178550.1 sugar ABC transporter permease [Chloroflexota bacterium]MBK7920504.1 sugar ABC transporter permease [Chloroflexota bacterium]MBK8933499.1 sugar ABC transporter permease [Chloroflexota bacterium]
MKPQQFTSTTESSKAKFPWKLPYKAQMRLFLLPYVLGTIVLVVIPAVATVLISFTEYKAVGAPRFVGLQNYRDLLGFGLVRTSLRNSAIFLLLAVPLRLLGALVLALLLQRKGRMFGSYRAAVYAPTIIPEAAYALLWLWIFNPVYGPLNLFLGWLGLPTPDWLIQPGTARLAIVILSCFQIGEGFVVLLAGLQSIPRSFYESAKVDGATWQQSFWQITLPLLSPWLMLLTFRDLIMSLQNTFTPSFIITYGGPYYATTFAPLLIYELAFDYMRLGLAAALLLLTYVLLGLIVLGILNAVGLGGSADEA